MRLLCAQANSIPASCVSFVYGDWADVCSLLASSEPSHQFDLMLTSETIYNTDYYSKLCNLIARFLKPGGVCLLATKRFYFGVGGGMRAFEGAALKHGLHCEVIEVLEDKASNIRELCVVRHAK